MSESISIFEPDDSNTESNKNYLDINHHSLDPSNILINPIEETFVDLIKKIILNDELKKKFVLVINEETLSIVNKIMSLTPNTFTDIENSIKEIVKDKKIDSNDIPQLIILLQTLYQVIYGIKNTQFDVSKIAEITASILKFLITILVEEKKININKDDKEYFYKYSFILIDSCVSLLSFSKSIKQKGCWKSIFCGN